MNTAKPISTISYNSEGFLTETLDALLKNGTLEFWAYINHLPEPVDDDGNGKIHNHVHVIPAKRVQTEGIRTFFHEFDPKCPKIPLGTMPWWQSKFSEWYPYVLHDPTYLQFKGLVKKYHYKPEMVQTSDRDYLNYLVRQIDLSVASPVQSMAQAVSMGFTFEEYFMHGKIPIQQMRQWKDAWDIITRQQFGNRQNVKSPSEVSDKSNKGNQQ